MAVSTSLFRRGVLHVSTSRLIANRTSSLPTSLLPEEGKGGEEIVDNSHEISASFVLNVDTSGLGGDGDEFGKPRVTCSTTPAPVASTTLSAGSAPTYAEISQFVLTLQ